MTGVTEFWLAIHQLADAYSREGETLQERFDNVLAQFRRMPAIARRELLIDFALLARHIPDVYSACNAAHQDAEQAGGSSQQRPKTGDAVADLP